MHWSEQVGIPPVGQIWWSSIGFHHRCMFANRKTATSADCKSLWLILQLPPPPNLFPPIVSNFPFHFSSILRECHGDWERRQEKNVYFRYVLHVLMYSFKRIDTAAQEKRLIYHTIRQRHRTREGGEWIASVLTMALQMDLSIPCWDVGHKSSGRARKEGWRGKSSFVNFITGVIWIQSFPAGPISNHSQI